MIFSFGVGEHRVYSLDKVSALYRVSIDLTPDSQPSGNPEETCGAATVTLRSKRSGAVVQQIRLARFAMFTDQPALNGGPGKPQPSPYDDNYSVICEDINFDGIPDFAFCDGTNSGYGLPSYQIYLFDQKSRKFKLSPAFTKLAQEHLGMFDLDTKKRRILVSDKDGAAWHQSSSYSVVEDRPVLMEQVTDDATGAKEVITERRRSHGKWKLSKRTLARAQRE